MRKYIYIGLLLLLCAGRASAQFTLVSGTITDSSGLPYSCGTLSASIVNLNGQNLYLNGVAFSPQPGAAKLGCPTDPTTSRTAGAFTLQLADNTQIKCGSGASIVTCGSQTQWLFTINTSGIPPPLGTGPQVCTAQLTISGASQVVTFPNCANLALSNVSQTGGVNSQTANYSAVVADGGKLIVMNGASLTVTLPNPPPSPTWTVSVLNLNSTPVTILHNGLTINTFTTDAVLYGQYTGLTIYTDGSNYFTNPAFGSAVTLRYSVVAPNQSLTIGVGNFTIVDSGSFTDFLDNGNLGTLTLGRTGATHTLLGGWVSGGTQTISGCSLTAPLGGTKAGKFASGTSGTCTVTITFPAAPSGWTCDAHDLTTAADANNVVQTAFTTTTATLSGTTVSGDVITWKCEGW